MKIKEKIRQKISQSLDVLIPENRWEQYIELLDRDGKFTRKNMLAMVMITCQQVEKLENLLEDLYFQIEMAEGKNPIPRATDQEFKLRTPLEVNADLEKLWNPDTKCFYISNRDWEILGKSVDPAMAKTKPEYGYGKEQNPNSGKEEVCLYFKDLPVFRNKK